MSNLNSDKKGGVIKIYEMIENQELLIFLTDKSKTLSVDRQDNYQKDMLVHIANFCSFRDT